MRARQQHRARPTTRPGAVPVESPPPTPAEAEAAVRRPAGAAAATMQAERVRRVQAVREDAVALEGRWQHPAAQSAAQHPAAQGGAVAGVRERAELIVRAPSHRHVQVGPSILAGAGVVRHVRIGDSTDVVLGDHCTLRERDHYHVRRLTIAPMPPLPPAAVRALARVARRPEDESAVRDFQRAIRPLCQPAAEPGPGQVRVHLPPGCPTTVEDSVGVVVGDRTRVDAEHRYVVDESVLRLPDLLARSRGLVREYARAAAQPGRGERAFLARLVYEAGRSSDQELLRAARGLPTEETTLLSLFGVIRADRASGATVGVDNRIRSSVDVESPWARPGRVLTGLGPVRGALRDPGRPEPCRASEGVDVPPPPTTRPTRARRARFSVEPEHRSDWPWRPDVPDRDRPGPDRPGRPGRGR